MRLTDEAKPVCRVWIDLVVAARPSLLRSVLPTPSQCDVCGGAYQAKHVTWVDRPGFD